jgi:hypothetical protein
VSAIWSFFDRNEILDAEPVALEATIVEKVFREVDFQAEESSLETFQVVCQVFRKKGKMAT